jgi:uncharacterized protein YodC (DUF2158 family)
MAPAAKETLMSPKFRNAREFRPGDVVQLRSGGPRMTVEGLADCIGEAASIECQWFAGAKLCYGCFAAESLLLVERTIEDIARS